MQNYNPQYPGSQRPGSTASFSQVAPPPPPYGAPQGYTSTAPSANSQWAPPAQNTGTQWNQQQAPQRASWGQPPAGGVQQPGGGGYNPGTYGPMPGASYTQNQQQDQPPPPPPKPEGYPPQPQHTQHGTQGWGQQSTGYHSQGQGQGQGQGQQAYGHQPIGVQQSQSQPQYNNAAPPPPSQTPGGSYFPPPQGGRPGSIYGADQAGTYSTPQSAAGQQPPNTVLSPNEQQPAYIPPSLTGQGVQSYMPANTNPMPGVYIPPPPDVPAWQQATHAPLQGENKKFTYTKLNPVQSNYGQGYGNPGAPNQQAQQPGQYGQQYTQQAQAQQPNFDQPPQHQHTHPKPHHQHQASLQAGQFVQPSQPLQQQLGQQFQPQQPIHHDHQQNQQQSQFAQQPVAQPHAQTPYGQGPHSQPIMQQQQQQQQQQQTQSYSQQEDQWKPTPPAEYQQQPQQNTQVHYNSQAPQQAQQQQQAWLPGHQSQGSVAQQYNQGQVEDIQAPKPLGRTGTTPPDFVNNVSMQSQPVSPIQGRQSMHFASGQSFGLARADSVSSIALGAIRNQQAQSEIRNADNRTSSPAVSSVPPPKIPTPPPPRDSKEKFSALGFGGPSDWEHFGDADNEVDDEELFSGKKDGQNEPAQLDSVELPGSHPCPPSAGGEWPTPLGNAAQPAPLNTETQRRDTYQPTPPPGHNTGTPAQSYNSYQSPQPIPAPRSPKAGQGFVSGDAIVKTQSPQPTQVAQPPPAQQSFVMDDGGWVPPTQSTPVQQQQHPPAPTQQGFVVDDGGWSTQNVQRQQTPAQQEQRQLPPHQAHTAVVTNDGTVQSGHPSQPGAQEPNGWTHQPHNQTHVSELKAKDEAYENLRVDADRRIADVRSELERLRSESEKEKVELRAEVERLTVKNETEKEKLRVDTERLQASVGEAKSHAEGEITTLKEQIEAMKIAVDQARVHAEASDKEKLLEIERWKEDAEGKQDTIKERDTTIANLTRQLDAEKSKEHPPPPQPTPADLIPDLDPWYVGALERFIDMLRREAAEPHVEDKIKVFKEFLKTASAARGLDYHDGPPATALAQGISSLQTPEAPIRNSFDSAKTKQDIQIQIPDTDVDDQVYQYSPGGRPIIAQRPNLNSNESSHSQYSSNISSTVGQDPPLSKDSATILTPTSSTDEDNSKTPIQSPPDEKPQPQYKAYVPPAGTSNNSIPPSHRLSLSAATTAPVTAPAQGTPSGSRDEIFFSQSQSNSKPTSRPTTSASTNSDVSIPAPLSFTPQRSVTPAANRKGALESLKKLLPTGTTPLRTPPRIDEIRKKNQALSHDFSFINEIITKFDQDAAQIRKRNDDARRKRQEESEAETDQLFNENEISYADIGALEDEFKEKERRLKAQEDRDEYKSYVEQVFDKVYDGLQADIKMLMDLYIDTEALLHSSTSGVQALSGKDDTLTTQSCLELMQELHDSIETRQDKVVAAVAERDRRYKKTEIQPLYAAGNISKMKSIEKHFEKAEKEAVFRANSEKAERVGELVRVAEEEIVSAVGTEQGEIDAIVAAIREVEQDGKDGDERVSVIKHARDTIVALRKSSKDLLTILNAMEIKLNTSVLQAEIAKAHVQNADPKSIADLEREMAEGEKKLNNELARKIRVLEQDTDEVEGLIQEKGAEAKLSEEDERKVRLKAALEEAKRRNGDM
ncbi:hypothetical protein BU24DRAFT_450679 [Aaosphaeria arxii CBS 175.79]|uniref:Uncharacterized protein n=1 Tax=Aaosphaeria arxii CBS 175.79 TaxID=1450172 RepID=A0A6A5XT23_9PLEO|nr:uncharacterized protein BU24DRAFT_450679 [Aaosphaeria arxii CBS 175.79]KAF2016076.1 hypothetical protein BU24DRAFT_450679 [Aaosphaeria arxii CBS 175.79]